MYGQALDMDRLVAITRRHGLLLVEDCAQAVGARWDGRAVGTFGSVGCFSFHPSKNLAAAGDAGAVVTDDVGLAERLRQLRNLGQRAQNDHVRLGYSSRLDSLQALVLSRKLDRLDAWNARRRAIAAAYTAALDNDELAVPRTDLGAAHVFHMYQVAVPRREQTLATLRSRGVDAVVRYPVPIARQPAFADQEFAKGTFPNAAHQAENTLCLPLHPALRDDQIERVVKELLTAVR